MRRYSLYRINWRRLRCLPLWVSSHPVREGETERGWRIKQMRSRDDGNVTFVLIKFRVIKFHGDKMSAKDVARYVTHLEYLTTKEVFFHWKQSALGFSQRFHCCVLWGAEGQHRCRLRGIGIKQRISWQEGVTSNTNERKGLIKFALLGRLLMKRAFEAPFSRENWESRAI